MNTRRAAAILTLAAIAIGGTATTASAGTKWTAPRRELPGRQRLGLTS